MWEAITGSRHLLFRLGGHLNQAVISAIDHGSVITKTDQVKCGSSLEPFNLALVERVRKRNILNDKTSISSPRYAISTTDVLGTIDVLSDEGQVLAGSKRLETENVHLVVGLNLVIVLGIGERQGEHTLLLQVGLMDTSKGADNDRKTTEVTRFEGSVFTRGTFTIVVVTNGNPLDAVVAVVGSSLGDTVVSTSHKVLDLVGLTVLSVNGTDQAVLYDKVRMKFRQDRRRNSREMFWRCPRYLSQGPPALMWSVAAKHNQHMRILNKNCSLTALALHLDQDGEISGGLSIPSPERLKKLETVTRGVDSDSNSSTVYRGWLEGILTRIVSSGRKLIARGVRELEGLAIGADKGIGDRVEGEVTSKGHGGHDVRRGDESMCSGVSIVATSEVTVVRGDDLAELEAFSNNQGRRLTRVNLSLLDILPVPLTNARTTSICKDETTGALESTHLTVTLNSSADLFRTRSDRELALDIETVRRSFLGNGSGAGHVFV